MPLCANCHSRKLTAALRATCLSKDKIPRLLRTEVMTQQGLAALPAVWCLYRSNVNNWKEKTSPSWEAFLFIQRDSWKRSLQTTHAVMCSTQAINNSHAILGQSDILVPFHQFYLTCSNTKTKKDLAKTWYLGDQLDKNFICKFITLMFVGIKCIYLHINWWS